MSTYQKNKLKHNSLELEEKIKKLEEKSKLPFFNCHIHIFNFKHIHNNFLKGMIPWWARLGLFLIIFSLFGLVFSKTDKIIALVIVIILSPILLIPLLDFSFSFLRIHSLLKNNNFRKITNWLQRLLPGQHDFLERYANFILHSYDTILGKVKSQEEIFNNLQSYYPKNTKFVALSMDLDYMVHCKKPPKGKMFFEQLDELDKIKQNPIYTNNIYLFIHIDPRRLENNEQNYYKRLETYINSKTFQGLKIYPPLGYFPFDRRLKSVYDLALKYNLPITAHCSVGPVYYRGNIKTLKNDGYFERGRFIHPFTGNELQGNSSKKFTPHFTHPLNYYCLMNMPEKLFEYWQKCDQLFNKKLGLEYSIDDLKKYKDLKFCLGHYGGSSEWLNYLQDPWLPKNENTLAIDNDLIHLPGGKWVHKVNDVLLKDLYPNSWYTIISDMLVLNDSNKKLAFPNLYADISYNLTNEVIYPLLKVILETNKTLSKKILFGTDFYMVSMKATERVATLNLRSFIGEENFKQIAVLNPLKFLSSKIIDGSTLLKI